MDQFEGVLAFAILADFGFINPSSFDIRGITSFTALRRASKKRSFDFGNHRRVSYHKPLDLHQMIDIPGVQSPKIRSFLQINYSWSDIFIEVLEIFWIHKIIPVNLIDYLVKENDRFRRILLKIKIHFRGEFGEFRGIDDYIIDLCLRDLHEFLHIMRFLGLGRDLVARLEVVNKILDFLFRSRYTEISPPDKILNLDFLLWIRVEWAGDTGLIQEPRLVLVLWTFLGFEHGLGRVWKWFLTFFLARHYYFLRLILNSLKF